MNYKFITLLVVFLCIGSSYQLGTLWVNQIWGNFDTQHVMIEEIIIDDNTMKVDFVDELGVNGVSVEEVNFKDGSVYVPVNLEVDEVGTIWGLLNANGGILADAGDEGGFSFKVEDNTGITTIQGETRPNGGINADQGKFTVQDETGETRIADALLRPDGGIDSNDGQFTVDAETGDVSTQGNARVELDIELGTNENDDRFIMRRPASCRNGGDTRIQGQSAAVNGGDLIFEPGYRTGGSSGDNGRIIFGRQEGEDLWIGRSSINGPVGGRTNYYGQSTDNGNGGDLVVKAGDSNGNGNGGDIVLVPGKSTGSGSFGQIVLGPDDNSAFDTNVDIQVVRPNVVGLDGGSTTFQGQSTSLGDGGDFTIQAGNGANNGAGGNINLRPGTGLGNNGIGSIFLGTSNNDELSITRALTFLQGGTTFFKGQDSRGGDGGDLVLQAGNAGLDSVNNFDGGDLILRPGQSGAGSFQNGRIVVGQPDEDLIIQRPDANGNSGTATTINGQSSNFGNGGDLNFIAGSGENTGGDINFSAGDANNSGGSVSISAGNGGENGGDLIFFAGSSTSFGQGGAVSITAGSSNGNGGNVVIEAGTGSSGYGDVVIQTSRQFIVEEGQTILQDGDLLVQNGGDTVMVTASNPNDGIIFYNGEKILTSRIENVVFPPDSTGITDCATAADRLESLTNSVQSLLNALGQCGHGLVNLVDRTGSIGDCSTGFIGFNFPAPIPDITNGFDFYGIEYNPINPSGTVTEPDDDAVDVALNDIP